MAFTDLLEQVQGSATIFDSYVKADSVIAKHNNIAVSISGGKDSDIMLDLMWRVARERERELNFVWFNTGVEYRATKEHLKYLEDRYGIQIQRIPAIKPIPLSVKEYGQPFLSKRVSNYMERLQRHDFRWEDEPLDILLGKYDNCRSALRWWCSDHSLDKTEGGNGKCNISYNAYLKEFIVNNPPWFKISDKCCTYAKKDVSKHYVKKNGIDLDVSGVRKAEGGTRATSYKTCFNTDKYGIDTYRPLFWYKSQDEKDYDELFDIKHSDCYEVWGMKRTGCVGCPFGRELDQELVFIDEYEPRLMVVAKALFSDSYEYTRMYREYAAKRKAEEKAKKKTAAVV